MGGNVAANSTGGQPSFFTSMIPIILIFAIFYVLIIRPQQKKANQHRDMIASLKKGDQVITTGGLYGRVIYANDPATVILEIAEKVKVTCARPNIAGIQETNVLPASGKADDNSKQKKK